MAFRRTDIEQEMSKFEEEISRLAPNNVPRPQVVISAPPVQALTIKPMSQYQPIVHQQSTMPTIKLPTTYTSIETPISMPVLPIPHSANAAMLKRDSSYLGYPNEVQHKKLKETPNTSNASKSSTKKNKKIVRMAGGQKWEDETLNEWEQDDFRLFCGDLGNEVNDELLTRAFQKYPSFLKAKVVRDKRSGKTKGYGFISFKDSQDFIKAMREMNGKYVGNRPIKLRKSSWKDRNIEIVKKKETEKAKMGLK